MLALGQRAVIAALAIAFAAPVHAAQTQAQLFVTAQVVEGVRVDTAAAGQRDRKAWSTNAYRTAVVEKLSVIDCGDSVSPGRICKRLELTF